jgi:c-di-GMP-binding flagellar brake protein YcgR
MKSLLPVRQSERSLIELNPTLGESVQIVFESTRRKYKVKLVGILAQEGVIVTSPSLRTLQGASLEGQSAVLSLMCNNRLCTFKARLMKTALPISGWLFSYPEQVQYHRVRSHTRIPVQCVASVDHCDEARSIALNLPKIVYTKDISLEGMGVEATAPLGYVDEQLLVTFRFQMAGADQVALIPVVLKNITEEEPGVFVHGLLFHDMEEETRHLLSGFVYQQYLMELGYLDDE